MGSSNKPSPAPSPANIESDDYSTNQEAQPLRWFVGTARCPLTWLTEIHNLRRVPIYHSAKKTSVKIGDKIFGDIAGAACLGPIHAIRAIEVDNEIIWEGNITVPDTFGGGTGVTGDNGVPPSPTPPANNTPANNRATIATDRGTFYIYYGNAWQPLDDILLAPVSAAFPDLAHPAYRGQCYCVCKNFYFGDSRNTVPNVTLLLERYPQTTMINSDTSGSLRPPLSDGGCTPAAAVLDLLISSLYGLGVSRETLGISGNYSSGSGTWWLAQNQYKAVTLSYDGYPSKLLAIAPSIDRTQPASDLLRSLLEIYQQAVTIDKNGTLVWKGNPYQKSLYLHQFVEKPALTQNSPDLAPTQVTVKFSDSTRNFKETSVTLTKPSPNSIIPLPTKKDLSLPALLTQESARTLAAHYLAQTNFGDASLSLKIRHTHSYDYEWYSGSYNSNPPLLPGDLVLGRFIEPPEGVSQNYKNNQATLWRITRREDEYEGDVTLTAVPNPPYERVRPCVDEAAILPELFPTPVANATILDLPPSLRQSSDNQAAIIILAERPPAQYAGTDVTTSFVSSFILHHAPLTAPNAFAAIGEYANWSLRATLSAGITDSATTLTLSLPVSAPDLDLLQSQSDTDKTANTLLLIADGEVMSVGQVTINADGTRTLQVLRARLGTTAAAHDPGATLWLNLRDRLAGISHASWLEGQTSRFKLQSRTPRHTLPLADAAVLTHTFATYPPPIPPSIYNANISATDGTANTSINLTASVYPDTASPVSRIVIVAIEQPPPIPPPDFVPRSNLIHVVYPDTTATIPINHNFTLPDGTEIGAIQVFWNIHLRAEIYNGDYAEWVSDLITITTPPAV